MTAAPGPAPAGAADDGRTRCHEGALSALLQELARAPPVQEEGWERLLVPGAVVGRFELLREVGQGGFGVVFEAEDRELHRRVAFKALRPGAGARAPASAWMAEEAEAVARLNHPGIVTLYDAGRCEAGPYLVLELLRGETLAERLARGPLAPERAVALAAGVAAALAHAHAARVVHRDLKPGNVFVTEEGGVKLLDFGIAHVLGRDLKSAGTPAFMAPEQRRGGPEGPAVDVYAVGALLAAMVGGAPPREPGAAPRLPAGTPRPLAEVIARALQPDPALRPADGAALLVALEEVAAALPGGARRRAVRRRLALAAGLACAILSGAVAGHLWRRWHAPVGPVPVAVADLENATGQPALDGLAGLLATSLEQSRALDVVTRARLVELARQRGREEARLQGDLAREVARAAGVRALLLGRLTRDGAGYALALEAVDPAAERRLFEVREVAPGEAQLSALVDRISARVRRELNERAEDVRASEVRVAQALTGSLEAYQRYFEGEQCSERVARVGQASLDECAELYRRALEVDPTFALARYALAVAPPGGREPGEEERAQIAEAVKHLDRVPEKERLLIRAWAAHLDGRDEDALGLYRTAASRFPRETKVLLTAGEFLHDRGAFSEALPWLDRVLALDPAHGWALEYLVDSLGHLGRGEELRRRIEVLQALPRQPAVLHALSEARGWAGDRAGAIAAARDELEAGGGATAEEDLVKALVFDDRLEEAERELRRQLALAPNDPWARLDLAAVLGTQGRRREGLELLRSPGFRADPGHALGRSLRVSYLAGGDPAALAREAEHLDPAGESANLASTLAYGRLPALAERLASRLDPSSPPARMYAAVRLWRAGRPEDAARELAEAEPRDRSPSYTLPPAFLAAEVALDAGRDREAVDAVRRFHAVYDPVRLLRSWAYPRSFLVLARASLRLGDEDAARGALARLLALWRRADEGEPLLAEARALQRSLGPERGRP
ncbi:serine/threonine-protein kinase [Anaeromyxobacter diazotrophicus]|uniref:Protein kinase domain-containing protein n=1 Tax=Anaeromyxobacter diazotrophicus TaxID=2590199 RepID=A0A7I9VRK2_9BACT|nr:serine/threonine-protein kinase [Anaeromyxobacter diazotrophicus]GEJ58699.1 hypothetical protein AMYX_34400 [Anaeromyxobacter diazotrophicus]